MVKFVDVDDYFWLPTDPPYTTKRQVDERLSMIRGNLEDKGWVLSGSCDGWGDELMEQVDLIVFLTTPHSIRMARLMAREHARHGRRILPGGDMAEIHTAFVEWASQYDSPLPSHSGRHLARHEDWLSRQSAPILRLEGIHPPDALSKSVLSML